MFVWVVGTTFVRTSIALDLPRSSIMTISPPHHPVASSFRSAKEFLIVKGPKGVRA